MTKKEIFQLIIVGIVFIVMALIIWGVEEGVVLPQKDVQHEILKNWTKK